tara:strand:+ start:1149 stop:1253 length:105 start_codon:yes stop_codon:yes gene_type:complete
MSYDPLTNGLQLQYNYPLIALLCLDAMVFDEYMP